MNEFGAPLWIEIPGWDDFQHYKNRDPVWIKNYRTLLSKPEYVLLTFPQRGLLHGIWLLYAESHRSVPVSTSYLSRQLGGRVTKGMLLSLSHAGFITVSASRPLAPRYQDASPEEETEREGETEVLGTSNVSDLPTSSSYIARGEHKNGFDHDIDPDADIPIITPDPAAEAARYVERDDDGNPYKIGEMQRLTK